MDRGDDVRTRALRRDLVAGLLAQGAIRSTAVEAAFRAVPRHLFVPDASILRAYAEAIVPTKFNAAGEAVSALSQPTIVAVMLEQLEVARGMRVLEIGAGTGYNAALLGRLIGSAGHVVSIDVDEDIVIAARTRLAAARREGAYAGSVDVVLGDGAMGHGPGAPFDRIIATVGAGDLPSAWLEQLGSEGRLVVPLRIKGVVTRSLAVVREAGGIWRAEEPESCSFMPLRGIADDLGQSIDLTADGLVSVETSRDQDVDVEAIARVLGSPGTELFTGVTFAEHESFEDLDLYMTCALPDGMSRLWATGPAVESGVVRPQSVGGGMCAVERDSIAYLTLRPAGAAVFGADESLDGSAKRWELGVVGHGPRGGALAAETAEHIRLWDERLRGASPILRIAQGTDRDRLTGRCVVDKPLTRIAVEWAR